MELEFRVNKPLEVVFDYLSDPQKFVSIHPIIERIEPLEGNHYKIVEKLPLGFFSYSFVYQASFVSDKPKNRVLISANVMNLVRIEIIFGLENQEKGTIVKETVNFHSFLPVHFFVKQIFEEQHQKLFANLNKL